MSSPARLRLDCRFPAPSGDRAASASKRGLTLIEMLVALVITLIMMAAVVRAFGLISENVGNSRAMIETNDRVRAAANRLRDDLAGVTVTTTPWTKLESSSGYFEYFEGPGTEFDPFVIGAQAPMSVPPLMNTDEYPNKDFTISDFDDVLMFTTRCRNGQFIGKFGASGSPPVQSPLAEVAWFTAPGPIDTLTNRPAWFTLYRRCMLIAPAVTSPGTWPMPMNSFYDQYDLSAHIETSATGGPVVRLNSLNDLSRREFRWAHLDPTSNSGYNLTNPSGYPYASPVTNNGGYFGTYRKPFGPASGPRFGEDVILTHVVGFDVKVWDPGAPIMTNLSQPIASSTATVGPGDYSYNFTSGTPVAYGAYVDLGYTLPRYTAATGAPQPLFSGNGQPKSKLNSTSTTSGFTYDTWTTFYERNGIRDGLAPVTNVTDAGTNGVDDLSAGTDAVSERETSPPYPAPLRGIQIKIRVIEPDSRQLREVTIQQSFMPE